MISTNRQTYTPSCNVLTILDTIVSTMGETYTIIHNLENLHFNNEYDMCIRAPKIMMTVVINKF